MRSSKLFSCSSFAGIRSESARFLVGGTRKGQGVVLLYPDKLATVSVLRIGARLIDRLARPGSALRRHLEEVTHQLVQNTRSILRGRPGEGPP